LIKFRKENYFRPIIRIHLFKIEKISAASVISHHDMEKSVEEIKKKDKKKDKKQNLDEAENEGETSKKKKEKKKV
jgi:hypothetical protein